MYFCGISSDLNPSLLWRIVQKVQEFWDRSVPEHALQYSVFGNCQSGSFRQEPDFLVCGTGILITLLNTTSEECIFYRTWLYLLGLKQMTHRSCFLSLLPGSWADRSPLHEAASQGRLLALRTLLSQVKYYLWLEIRFPASIAHWFSKVINLKIRELPGRCHQSFLF